MTSYWELHKSFLNHPIPGSTSNSQGFLMIEAHHTLQLRRPARLFSFLAPSAKAILANDHLVLITRYTGLFNLAPEATSYQLKCCGGMGNNVRVDGMEFFTALRVLYAVNIGSGPYFCVEKSLVHGIGVIKNWAWLLPTRGIALRGLLQPKYKHPLVVRE